MQQVEINGFKRVDRGTAQRLFDKGHDVYGVPCNLSPSTGCCVLFNSKRGSFSQIENAAIYYNCNSEVGKKLWFYVYEKPELKVGRLIDSEFIVSWLEKFVNQWNRAVIGIELDRLRMSCANKEITKATYDNIIKILDRENVDNMEVHYMRERANQFLEMAEWIKQFTAKYSREETVEAIDGMIKSSRKEKRYDECEIYCLIRKVFKLNKVEGRGYNY